MCCCPDGHSPLTPFSSVYQTSRAPRSRSRQHGCLSQPHPDPSTTTTHFAQAEASRATNSPRLSHPPIDLRTISMGVLEIRKYLKIYSDSAYEILYFIQKNILWSKFEKKFEIENVCISLHYKNLIPIIVMSSYWG